MDKWIKAALIRAIKTFAETCIAMIPVGLSINEVSWLHVLGTAALAFVITILTCIAGLPEVDYEKSIELVSNETIKPREDNNEND